MGEKGFTLLELLAVLVIMMALTAIVVPIFVNKGELARNIAHDANVRRLKKQSGAYMLEHTYEIGENITDKLVNKGYIKEIPECPIPDKEGNNIKYSVIVISKGRVKVIPPDDDSGSGGSGNDINLIYNTKMKVNRPQLVSGMTAIRWDEDLNVIEVKDEIKEDWYMYNGDINNEMDEDKMDGTGEFTKDRWANVKLDDGSVFVWIPRYAYKVIGDDTDTSNDDQIQIKYLKGTSSDVSEGFKVHPVFKYGGKELRGIWFAKYEASNDSNNVTIKPGKISWQNISVKDIYDKCVKMNLDGNIYGLKSVETKSLMMRNRDWGAVAYLTEAIRDKEEVWKNNDKGYLTGSAGSSKNAGENIGTISDYKNEQCQKASTTGNVYGIYDMNGLSNEYVASYVANGNAYLDTYGGPLIGALDDDKDQLNVTPPNQQSHALNVYRQTEDQTNGMGIHEVTKDGEYKRLNDTYGGYNDLNAIPYTNNPFFMRGGNYHGNDSTGIFSFGYSQGKEEKSISFRPVLLVTK